MPNPHRGEIEACLDGKSFRLCLTLNALAELEHVFNDDDMLALAERFQKGRLSARDAQRIIGAGLRGAGTDIADEAVGRMQAEGGAAGFVDIVARLLSATFGGPAAPLIGTIAGEIVSGLTETKSAPDGASSIPPGASVNSGSGMIAPSELPSPSCRRHASDMMRKGASEIVAPPGLPSPLRGGVGGGGETSVGSETSSGGKAVDSDRDRERTSPFPFPGPT
jgi:hypothetical protein